MKSKQCYIIAEAGLNHNGSLELAKKLIDVASVSQVDAVKFQKRNVSTLAIKEILDAKDDRFPSLGRTYREIRESLEFNLKQFQELKEYAESKDLDFICTAFDKESVDFLKKLEINIVKIASHSVTNIPLIQYISEQFDRVIISSGMCTFEELDVAISILRKGCSNLKLLHCVSSYPQKESESNLDMINVLKKRYKIPIGYSGHELGYLPSLTAVALGASIIERHFTLDKNMEGFDHKISLEPDELFLMTKNIRKIESSLGNSEKKVSDTEMITRKKYHVSMVSKENILRGSILTEEMIEYRNPGTGISPAMSKKVIGRKVICDIPIDNIISLDMFE